MDPDRDERPTRVLTSPELRDLQQAATDPTLNPWAWVAEQPAEGAAADLGSVEVTAVLVTLDAEQWLPETLDGLARLAQRPTRLIAIDNGSRDDSAVLLARAREQGLIDAVYRGGRGLGFGAAVGTALEADGVDLAALAARPDGRRHWLWLLHDDAVPAPDALRRLLSHVVEDPTVDVTGPKLLLPARRHTPAQISEVGVTIAGTGRRERLLDTGEIDQGQRDTPAERLGLSTCGMLVRAAVWHDLGGLDPDLPLFRDGVDFGWRAHLRGYRVVTTPSARMSHRQVSHAGLRARGAAKRRPAAVDRHLGMLVVAANARRRALPLVWLRLVVSCLLGALGYVLGKAPGRARDELGALGAFLAHPGRIRAMRRWRAGRPARPGGREAVRALRPPWWSSLRTAAEAVTGVFTEQYRSVAGELEAATLDELTGDDFAAASAEPPKHPWLAPAVLVTVAAVLASLVAGRALWGEGSLAGPALLPAPDTLGGLWQRVVAPVAGAPLQTTPPWLLLSAVGSTLLFGQPEWFVTLLICGVVPVAFLAAYPVVRRVVGDRRLRVWAAATYALLPVLLGGTNQGRLSLSVFAVTLPALVLAATALVQRRPRTPEAWRGGWGAGVVLVILIAFEPAMAVVALLAGLAGAVALHRTPRKVGRIGIALAVPAVVLLPWLPSLLDAPGRLLVGPDAALGGVGTAPEVWELLVGRERGPGLPPLWLSLVVFGGVWLLAVAGLFRRFERRTVVAGWVAALLAFGAAILLSRLVAVVPPLDTPVRPWVGSFLLLAFAALVGAAAAGLDGLAEDVRDRSFSWVQPATVVVSVGVVALTMLGATWWVWTGAAGPVARVGLDGLPPYVRNDMTGPNQARVLAVDLTGRSAEYFVLADDQARLGDADRGFTFGGSRAAATEAEDLALRVLAGTADADIAGGLTELGIGYVWVTGANDEETAQIDNTPGLGTASGTPSGVVWQVQPPVARRSVVEGDRLSPVPSGPVGRTWRADLPPGAEGRQLRLGEPVDPRWRATVNGQPLAEVGSGWQQAYVLPPGGGTVSLQLRSITPWLWAGSGAVWLLALVVAAPGIRSPELRDPTRLARRAAVTAGGVR